MGHEQRAAKAGRCEELTGALVRIVVSVLAAMKEPTGAVTLGISFPDGDNKAAVHTATMAVSKEAERAHSLILAQSLAAEPVDKPAANEEQP